LILFVERNHVLKVKEMIDCNLHKDDPDERGSTIYYNAPSWTTMQPSNEL